MQSETSCEMTNLEKTINHLFSFKKFDVFQKIIFTFRFLDLDYTIQNSEIIMKNQHLTNLNWAIDQLQPPQKGFFKPDQKKIRLSDLSKIRTTIKAYRQYFTALYTHSYDHESLESYSIQFPELEHLKDFFDKCKEMLNNFWGNKQEEAASFLTKILKYIKHLQIEQQKCTEKLHYFVHSNVLNKFQEEKFLLATLEKYSGKKIAHVKEVYKFDQNNPTMLKNYIEGVTNNITIIKCINGKKIGIFSSLSLFGKQKAEEKIGLVVDFTTGSCHPLIEGRKLVSSDPKKLIFGNEQLSLDKDKNTLNFYSKQSSFNVSWEQILGEKNQIQFESFEIYKAQFELCKQNKDENNHLARKEKNIISEYQFNEKLNQNEDADNFIQQKILEKSLEDKKEQLEKLQTKIVQKKKTYAEMEKNIDKSEKILSILIQAKVSQQQLLSNLQLHIRDQEKYINNVNYEKKQYLIGQKIDKKCCHRKKLIEKSLIIKSIYDLISIRVKKNNIKKMNGMKVDQQAQEKNEFQERERKMFVLEKQISEKRQKLENEMKEKSEQLEKREVELNKRESLQGQLCGGSEFNGDIFYGFSEEKKYLVEELSKMNENRRIVGTKLLYSFPKFKECSFHPLVDGRKDYVVIILLQNRMKVAAYSKERLQKGVENKGSGFLASLTNKQSFTLKNTQKAKLTIYNDFFFKFGNSQLLIKLCEPKAGPLRDEDFKVKSNFGQSNTNDFFSQKYKNQEILFGENARETRMLHYEVFQVQFDE